MTPIESIHNERLKEIRKLARRRGRDRDAHFVAEGEDLVAAADAAQWAPIERLCATGSGLPGTEVEPGALALVSGLGSGTRTLAVYEQRYAPVSGPLCIYLHGVADPGNVGTVLRGALAFGVSCVVLGPGCADPYGPKAVRASMGAIFSVALASAGAGELPGRRVALEMRSGTALGDLDVDEGEVSLMIGAERSGLPADVVALADDVVHIPIASESLNAAMAATVALYEVTRKRSSRIAPA